MSNKVVVVEGLFGLPEEVRLGIELDLKESYGFKIHEREVMDVLNDVIVYVRPDEEDVSNSYLDYILESYLEHIKEMDSDDWTVEIDRIKIKIKSNEKDKDLRIRFGIYYRKNEITDCYKINII